MDFLRNVSVSAGEVQAPPPHASLDDLFPTQNTEVDLSLEWLSIFVEDCFSSTGNCIPVSNVANKATTTTETTTTRPGTAIKPHQITPPSLHKFVVPGKARSKRKRVSPTLLSKTKNNPFSSWSYNLQLANPDPLLLQQSCWLADSELIVPKKEDESRSTTSEVVEEKPPAVAAEEEEVVYHQQQQVQPRRCSHCLAQRTPQWRAGPLGPKTLCNACGVRYKSGRLLPEYRPAKSPTFVSYLHSNSHKKVMEMRLSSIPTQE